MSDVTIPNDGPVLNVINKRLRALRKKLNRITQMEESLSQGKTLNSEQLETLKSKPSVAASIDELEKLRAPLAQAVGQEIELNSSVKKEEKGDVVKELIKLVYFGSVFDVKTLMTARENLMTRTHERSCCLTYDYVTDEETEPLRELDLDFIAGVKELVVSRGVGDSFSHQKALEKCVEKARLWLDGSEETVLEDSSVTYAGLREKLNKIMASEYFTTTPEMKAPVEVEVAAGGANYTSFPVYGSVDASANMNVPVEGSVSEYQQEENKSPNSNGNVSYNEESGLVEEQHQLVQGGSDADNKSERPAEAEMGVPNTEADQNTKDVDNSKDQQHSTRRSYQNRVGRGGGGRRNFSNGRGGRGAYRGGYQNGRGQFYDQQSGYHPPRNQNFRPRGGRGMGGNYSYREPAEHAGHAQAA